MTKHNYNYSTFATDEQFLKLKTMIGRDTDVPLSPTGRAVLIAVDGDYATWIVMSTGSNHSAPMNKSFTLRTDWSWNCFFSTWMKGVNKNYVPHLKQ